MATNKKNNNKGYAILFAVVMVSVISLLAFGLSSSTFKQLVLSSLAGDSQIAYYQSDTSTECALYTDNIVGVMPTSPYKCGKDINGNDMSFTVSGSSTDYNLVSSLEGQGIPCFDFRITKTGASTVTTDIYARGYNSCIKTNYKTVEREIKITYTSGVSAPARNVTWTNTAGVNVSGNSLTKTAGDSWGNAGASSVQSITSGDGYVEFSTNENNTYKMAGLSNGDTNQNYDDIDFSLYMAADGTIYVYEGGTFIGNFIAYVAGDTFRVAVESGVVKYYKNGTVFYTSSKSLTYPLLVDTSLYSQNSTITNAKIYP